MRRENHFAQWRGGRKWGLELFAAPLSATYTKHNTYLHDCKTKHGLSLEETRKTTRWANRVFAFILAVYEMNAYLAMQYFGELKMTQLEFKKKIVFEFIHTTLESGTEEERPERRRNTLQNTLHKITTASPHSGFEGGKWVKKYKQK